MKHVTKIMIAGWNKAEFVSDKMEGFSVKNGNIIYNE